MGGVVRRATNSYTKFGSGKDWAVIIKRGVEGGSIVHITHTYYIMGDVEEVIPKTSNCLSTYTYSLTRRIHISLFFHQYLLPKENRRDNTCIWGFLFFSLGWTDGVASATASEILWTCLCVRLPLPLF